MSCSEKDRLEFIRVLREHVPDELPAGPRFKTLLPIAKRIMRHGATYARIQEKWCNGPEAPNGLTPELYNAIQAHYETVTVPFYERKEARIEKTLAELCESIGCKVICGGDPRGATVKVVPPDGFTNDWGREGICVPTS